MLLYIIYYCLLAPPHTNLTIPSYKLYFIMLYKLNEIVFAKCQDYPFWPAKVVNYFAQAASYKVVFYGEKSEATISESCMLPFTDEVLRKLSADSAHRNHKDLQHSIKIALKRLQKRRKGLASSSEEDDYYMDSEPPKRS